MIVSEARIAANRRNGALSKGPTSELGRSISRRNSLRAGLTGRGAVTSEKDAEEIARKVEAYTLEMRPRTELGAALIGQLALFAVRMKNAAAHEAAARASNVRHAIENFDEGRLEAADAQFAKLAEDPRSTSRKLRRSPEGLDRLIDAWTELRHDLTMGAWGGEQLDHAVNLTGLKARHAGGTMLGALTRALDGDFSGLDDSEGAGLDAEARKAWAKARLFEEIDGEIAGLDGDAEAIDFDAIELDRAEAPERALFDDSKAACLARRYEAEASRGFFRALKEFRKVEAEFASAAPTAPALPVPPPPPPPAPMPAQSPAIPASRMGSFREMPPMGDRRAAGPTSAAMPGEIPASRDGSGVASRVGRPSKVID